MTSVVVVWVCPTPGCGNYYGAASAGDLAATPKPVSAQSGRAPGSRGMRSACPACLIRGDDVDRVPHTITLDGSPVPDVATVSALRELHGRAEALSRRTGYAEANGIVHDVAALLEMLEPERSAA